MALVVGVVGDDGAVDGVVMGWLSSLAVGLVFVPGNLNLNLSLSFVAF